MKKKEREWWKALAVHLALNEYMPCSMITKYLQKRGLSKSAAYRILKSLEEDHVLIKVGSWNKTYDQGPRARKYLALAQKWGVAEKDPPETEKNGKTPIGGVAPPLDRGKHLGRVVFHHVGFKFVVRRWVKDPGAVPFHLVRRWRTGKYWGYRWRVPVEGVGDVEVTIQESKKGFTGYFYLPPLRADLDNWKEELQRQEKLAWEVLRSFCPRAGVEAGLLSRMDGIEGAVKLSHNVVSEKGYVQSEFGETWVDTTSGDGESGTFVEARGDMIGALLDAPHQIAELRALLESEVRERHRIEEAIGILSRVLEDQTRLMGQVAETQHRIIELLSPRRDYDDGGVMFG